MLELSDLVDDPEDFTWEQLGTCRNLPTQQITARPGSVDIMFDEYEADPIVATQVDQMCLSCPVAKQCLPAGLAGKHWGVWGGLYLENGKPNKARNAHKTDEVWDAFRRKHGRNVRV